ncbi:tRNA (N6-isopentenyl adenosine(37)-C2)-methylthiotransferase MiaB [Myxococcota bacterium]|nr:tRNA (N6-isopentenyl adenosine(37)-C2)-methylthiotransferase MiaB [Myxococcota bacterium]
MNATEPPRFAIRTFGCQMNVHDTEKMANLLLHAGYAWAESAEDAELLIINTCSIRDKAEQRLYSDLGSLRDWKTASPDRVLAVAGCVAQQQGDHILERFNHVDFVVGTHNLRWVASMAEAAGEGCRSSRVDETPSQDRFDLPERHSGFTSATPGRSFVTVMEGCDMFCTFCIVPMTRGREISREAARILEEVSALATTGVREVTLLGQTVNAYGRHDVRRGHTAQRGTLAFAELLARMDAIPGIQRIRYTSPHPSFYDDALIRAHAELESLCPHVHLPLQSGSDRILGAMRRRYRAGDFLRLVDQLREARADLAITTDLIVGFPGETDADFRETLRVVEQAGFVDGFSFKYSPRPGTQATQSDLPEVSEKEAQARLETLQEQLRSQTLSYHHSRVGEWTEVLVEAPSRRGGGQWMGRDPHHRVVNFELPAGSLGAGQMQSVQVVAATPHSLIGEASPENGVFEPDPLAVSGVTPPSPHAAGSGNLRLVTID